MFGTRHPFADLCFFLFAGLPALKLRKYSRIEEIFGRAEASPGNGGKWVFSAEGALKLEKTREAGLPEVPFV